MTEVTEQLPALPETADKYNERFLEEMDKTLDILPSWTTKLNTLARQIESFRVWLNSQMGFFQQVIDKADSIKKYAIPTNATYTIEQIDKKLKENIAKASKPYGVSWNSITDTYETLGHGVPIVQQLMRRCIVDANGSFLYYLHPDDSSKKENGDSAMADLQGANGTRQVKVQIPKFYQKRWQEGALNNHEISLFPFDGCEVHPIFKKAGWTKNDEDFESDYAYIGAFEGVLYDTSAGTFIDNNKQNDNTANIDLAVDKIMSVVGFKPYSGITIIEGRKLIENGGSKQFSYHFLDAKQLLFFTEYRTFNSQAVLAGYTGGGNADHLAKTGLTLSLGNKSGSIKNSSSQVAGVATSRIVANSYRGIENPFGHLWKFTDGITISFGKPFICEVYETFENNKLDGQYKQLKDKNNIPIQMPQAHGSIVEIHAGSFLAKSNTGGNTAVKMTDYYWYYGTGGYNYAVLLSGGHLSGGSAVGLFCFYGNTSSGTSYWNRAVRP